MKITRQQLRKLIQEIYEPGEFVPTSVGQYYPSIPGEPTEASEQSFQVGMHHQVLAAMCPATIDRKDIVIQGLELYNTLRGTNLSVSEVRDRNKTADYVDLFVITGSNKELLRFYSDFQGYHINNSIELRFFVGEQEKRLPRKLAIENSLPKEELASITAVGFACMRPPDRIPGIETSSMMF
mgnify:CR=1 FL=1